jgi:hypothetical protein
MEVAPRQTALLWATGLAVAVRAVHLIAVAHSAIPAWQDHIHQTDFYATWKWATEIRAGNWLGQPPFHPYTAWMQALGTQEEWERWWGGAQTFQQAPLYAYLVALISVPPDGSPVFTFAFQGLLAALCAPAVGILAQRWSGRPEAGPWAAFLWALSRTEVALDGFLVRDSLGAALLVGSLLLWELSRSSPRPLRLLFFAGVTLGLGVLQRENLLLLVPLMTALSLFPAPVQARRGLALILGVALALAPLFARNLWVGAPVGALSNRGPETVLEGMEVAPGASPLAFHSFPQMREELIESRASSLRAVKICLADGARSPARLLRLMLRKTRALLSAEEPTDNVDLEYLMRLSPALRLCLPTLFILVPGALGFLLCMQRHRRRAALGLWSLAVLFAPLLVVPVLWRYRVGLLPVLCPFAGIFLLWCWEQLRAVRHAPRGSRLALGSSALAMGLWLFVGYRFPVGPLHRLGPMGATLSAEVYLSENRPREALREVDDYLELVSKGQAEPFSPILDVRHDILDALGEGSKERLP